MKLQTQILTVSILSLALSITTTAQIVQQFEFNDAEMTSLSAAANSAGMVQYVKDLPGYSLNGESLVITTAGPGKGIESFSDNSTPLAYNSGAYQIDTTLSWTIQDDGSDQTFHVSLMDDNINKTTADISLEFRSGGSNVQINSRAFGGGTESAVYSGFSLSESNIQLRSVVDFDSRTIETFYNTGDGFISTGPAGSLSPQRGGNWLRIRTTGNWSGPAEKLEVDSISYTKLR